jgi:alanine dehydrogenase
LGCGGHTGAKGRELLTGAKMGERKSPSQEKKRKLETATILFSYLHLAREHRTPVDRGG